jgi:hypothetical protein
MQSPEVETNPARTGSVFFPLPFDSPLFSDPFLPLQAIFVGGFVYVRKYNSSYDR